MASEILSRLEKMGSQVVIATNERFGIKPIKTVGIKMPELRSLAKEIGMNHSLASDLWESGLREARIISTLTADPEYTDLRLMKRWADSADSWDVVDACCGNLFWKTRDVDGMIRISIKAEGEYSKRFGFVLMAYLAMKNGSIEDARFKEYIEMISLEVSDKRHYVVKAMDWALRTISARNKNLDRMVKECFGISKNNGKKRVAKSIKVQHSAIDVDNPAKRRGTRRK